MKRRDLLKTIAGLIGIGVTGMRTSLYSDSPVSKLKNFLGIGKFNVRNAKKLKEPVLVQFPRDSSINFLVIGDWGTGGSLQKSVADAMAKTARAEPIDFILSVGDNFYPKGVSSIDDKAWKTKFEDIYHHPELKVDWYSVLGNHDYRSNIHAQIEYHSINPRWHMDGRYFSFSKAKRDVSLFFAMFDSQIVVENRPQRSAQKKWLETEVSSNSSSWKFAVAHHPIRSNGFYGDNSAMVKDFKPIFDQSKLDIYFNGHEHDLQYIADPRDSFRCIVSGAGGGGRDTAYGANSLFAGTNGGFVFCSATKDQLHIRFIDKMGQVQFADTLSKKV